MPQYYFIKSKLNGFVLDISGANPASGTPVINYPQKDTGTDNQLWEQVATGPKDPGGGQDHFFVASKLNGNVIDIDGGNTAPGTRLISFPRKATGTDNQVWQFVLGQTVGQTNYFFIVSNLNGNVIDVEGANPAPGTQVISYPRKTTGTDNQLWELVPIAKKTSFGKKTAFGRTTN